MIKKIIFFIACILLALNVAAWIFSFKALADAIAWPQTTETFSRIAAFILLFCNAAASFFSLRRGKSFDSIGLSVLGLILFLAAIPL